VITWICLAPVLSSVRILTFLAKFVLYCRFSPMAKSETDILTISEVATYLKIAQRTVYRLAAAISL
jgi:hypothetical protein